LIDATLKVCPHNAAGSRLTITAASGFSMVDSFLRLFDASAYLRLRALCAIARSARPTLTTVEGVRVGRSPMSRS
jgi:hypothetical protein